MITIAIAVSVTAGCPSVAIFGDDAFCSLYPVTQALLDAGFCVTSYEDVADIDATDLSQFDVVWLPNGIDQNNDACPNVNPIPSMTGTDKLAAFVADGGGLYLPGEWATAGQQSFLEWRDALIVDLGGGDVDGVCGCKGGMTVYLDPSLEINTTPNVIETVGASSDFTSAFEAIGSGTGFAFTEPDFSGLPTGVYWDAGDLAGAPTGRIVSWNNSNNLAPFDLWAVNAATFLAGDGCVADCNDDGVLNILDFVAYQAAFVAGC